MTVTAEALQPLGASSLVTGAVASTFASPLAADAPEELPTLSETV